MNPFKYHYMILISRHSREDGNPLQSPLKVGRPSGRQTPPPSQHVALYPKGMIKVDLQNFFVFLITLLLSVNTTAADLSGNITAEYRHFPHQPLSRTQHGDNLSISIQPEYYTSWDNAKQSLLLIPYLRLDQGDGNRTHFDIREMDWITVADTWELRAGIRKVFWGVTESQHLVDIINQTDLVENIDTEDKLGQPMLNLAIIKDWGTVDLFLMPYFRERTFASGKGRLRPGITIDDDNTTYESSAEEYNLDLALRWSHTLGDWDLGLSHFHGNSRDPIFRPFVTSTGEVSLRPHYDIIDQTGLDIQATKDSWLWKLELIRRAGQEGDFVAMTGGFEYSFYGVFDSATDIGIVAEYLFDDRNNDSASGFDDDIMTGLRIALNDIQSTDALIGMVIDRNTGSRFYSIEASRRIGDSVKLSLEGRWFSGIEPTEVQYSFRNEDYLQLELGWYF